MWGDLSGGVWSSPGFGGYQEEEYPDLGKVSRSLPVLVDIDFFGPQRYIPTLVFWNDHVGEAKRHHDRE